MKLSPPTITVSCATLVWGIALSAAAPSAAVAQPSPAPAPAPPAPTAAPEPAPPAAPEPAPPASAAAPGARPMVPGSAVPRAQPLAAPDDPRGAMARSAPPGPPGRPPAPRPPPWWLGKERVPFEEGVPGPPGFVLRERASRGLVIGGSVTFGAAYVLSVATGAMALAQEDGGDDNGTWEPIFIPVVGPAVTAATIHASSAGSFVLIADSVVQAAGVGMFILGFTEPERAWVDERFSVSVTPGGVALRGRF